MFEIKKLHFKTTTSTQDEALKQLPLPENTLLVVTADYQTDGRGRLKRKWVAEPGTSLLVTFAFKTKDPYSLTQLLAVTLANLLEKKGFRPQIKWPNDLLINGKKLGGILAELKDDTILLGLGLNVNQEEIDINRPATSLRIEGEKIYEAQQILEELIISFNEALDLYSSQSIIPFLSLYKRFLAHKPGDSITIDNKQLAFERINNDGSLTASGRRFYSGDITY